MSNRVWIYLFLSAGSLALSTPLTLSELRDKMTARGIHWRAGATSVSGFTESEKRKLMGLQLDEGFGDFFKPAKTQPSQKRLPNKFDWRNKEGVNYSSPMLNQANCGSCVAFSAIGALETQMNIANNTPHSPWAFSPQHLFSCGGGGCETGWHPLMAVQFLQKTGVPDESCFPYASGGDGKDLACSQTCSDASKRSLKITNYSMPSFFMDDPQAVKEALLKGPLMTTMVVFEDFIFYKGGVYEHVAGEQLGGHAITLVGWDDTDKAWIVRNSWGEDWGEKGYFRVAYGDSSGVSRQTWGLEVAPSKGYVSLGDIRDHSVLSGVVQVDLKSTIAGTQNIEINLQKNEVPVFSQVVANGTRVNIDTKQFPDGVYTVAAIADTSSGKITSQPRTLYVLNGAFQGKVEFKNLTENETITDKKELELKTSGTPVPFTSVAFKAVNLKTGEENIRATYTVLPEMKMLWRAQYLENGDYRVFLEAKVGDKVKVESKAFTVKVSH